MSQSKVQLVSDIVGNVSGGASFTGIVTASAFSGDGSGLTGAGSSLEAASGSQRLVVTSLTSGTMTSAATDADLTWNSTTNTLSATNVSIAGGINAVGVVTANAFVDDGTNLLTEINTKASTGKSIAMSMIFG